MNKTRGNRLLVLLVIAFAFPIFLPQVTFAHCDGLDGPVVKAAKKALESGKVSAVLIWVQKKDEKAITDAFNKTLAVRKLDPKARELADMYFFETLVRIHRAGEGAPYAGLKPAGRDLGPAIPAADKAFEDGKLEPLGKLIMQTVEKGLHEQFEQAMAKKKFKPEDTEAGRKFIAAYVTYIHYVERLYESATQGVHGHYAGGEEAQEKAVGHGH